MYSVHSLNYTPTLRIINIFQPHILLLHWQTVYSCETKIASMKPFYSNKMNIYSVEFLVKLLCTINVVESVTQKILSAEKIIVNIRN